MLENLKKSFLFENLSNQALAEILAECRKKTYKQNEIILDQNSPNKNFYILNTGQVKIAVKKNSDTLHPITFLSAGNSFGEMSLVTGEPTSASVIAVIDSEVLTLSREQFKEILQKYPSVSIKLNQLLSQRLKETNLKEELKIAETGFSLFISHNDSFSFLLHAVSGISKKLTETYFKKTLLLVHSNQFTKDKLESIFASSLNSVGENEVFNLYQASEKLFLGILKKEELTSLEIQSTQLLSDFFKSYDQILSALPYDEETVKNSFFSQAKKVIHFFSEENPDELNTLVRPTQLSSKETAAAWQLQNKSTQSQISRIRKIYRGPIFLFSKDASVQFSNNALRACRFLLNKTVGVVLGGGGARGFAHIGVIKTLEKNGLEPDAYCGSSMGGIIAALFSMGYTSEEVTKIVSAQAKQKGNKFDFHFPYRSIIKGKKLEKMAYQVYGDATFDDINQKLYLVCADLMSGEEVVLDKGLLRTAVYASADMPGIMPPVRLENQYLIDGSVLNKVPVNVLKERGIEHVIAVNVTPKRDPSFARKKKEPHILNIITRSFEMINYKLSYAQLTSTDVLIEPKLNQFEFFGFNNIEGIIDAGAKTAELSLNKINRVLYSS